MRISDWSSDVCSSDLRARAFRGPLLELAPLFGLLHIQSHALVAQAGTVAVQRCAKQSQRFDQAFADDTAIGVPPRADGDARVAAGVLHRSEILQLPRQIGRAHV